MALVGADSAAAQGGGVWTPASFIALAAWLVAIGGLAWNRWDRRIDFVRVARNQLSDVLVKLSATVFELAAIDFRQDSQDTLPSEQARFMRGGLRDRIESLARQALYLTRQIPTHVASIEYTNIAMAFEEVGELSRAEEMIRQALDASESTLDTASAERKLGSYLFQRAKPVEGRVFFERAIRSYSTVRTVTSGSNPHFEGLLTEVVWVRAEISNGDKERGKAKATELRPRVAALPDSDAKTALLQQLAGLP